MPVNLPPPHIPAISRRRHIASNTLRRVHKAGNVDHLAWSCAGVAHHGNATPGPEQPGAGLGCHRLLRSRSVPAPFTLPPASLTPLLRRCGRESSRVRNEPTCQHSHRKSPSSWPTGRAQTNGVAECFFKTLKEQIIHGRIYRTIAELRAAFEAFVDLYNEQWLPEKNGYLSPSATRAAWYAREAQGVAAQEQLRVQVSASVTPRARERRPSP